MTALLARFWPYIAGGLAVLALGGAIVLLNAQKNTARAERDLARVELVGMRAAVDAANISTHAAVGAAERCSADATESNRRCTSVLAAARAEAERYRGQLRACVSPAAVAERLRTVFP